ncbi:sensor histidine kinase [Thermopolyspora sp. NPDC052614]|uniref:sensor histidine kinase n=1 Tax=Thermopolyspora sp. NPDC052614 TaxID=3155682 RepID=UPI0034425A76
MRNTWGWPVFGLSCVLVGGGVVAGGGPTGGHGTVVDAALGLAFPALGAFLLARKVVLLGALCLVPALGAVAYAADNHAAAALPGARWTAWLSGWVWAPAVLIPATLVVLLVPDGRLPSRRWRPFAIVTGALVAAFTLLMALVPQVRYGLPAPISAPGLSAQTPAFPVLIAALIVACVGCVAALPLRLRRARGEVRLQLLWVLTGAATLVLTTFGNVWFPAPWNDWVAVAGVLAFPAGVGVAMLRHGLYDTDRVLRRTLTYGLLAGALALAYVAVVAGLGLLAGPDRPVVAASAAVVVAIAVNPVRGFLARLVDRALYGERGDPYGVLTGLSRRLAEAAEPRATLTVLAASIASALRVPRVHVRVGPAEVEAGDPSVPLERTVPLTFQGTPLGQVRLAPRAPGEGFDPRDRRLLDDIALQAGGPLAAALRALELQRARRDLVTAREEERRKLRRDLHDGLGPVLAGLGFTADAACNALRSDPVRTEHLLGTVRQQARDAAATVRRLSRGLRPPDLDALGLVPAIEAAAARLSPPKVEVTVSGEPYGLDAATEVAAYLVTREALTNCARHAGASSCRVRISFGDDRLTITITDDGRGLPGTPPAGVGLAAMRERAEELGGDFAIGSPPVGGTEVRVRLPVGGVA